MTSFVVWDNYDEDKDEVLIWRIKIISKYDIY